MPCRIRWFIHGPHGPHVAPGSVLDDCPLTRLNSVAQIEGDRRRNVSAQPQLAELGGVILARVSVP